MSVESVTYIAAFGGGVASCVSPCVLPILPGYLSMITGIGASVDPRATPAVVAGAGRGGASTHTGAAVATAVRAPVIEATGTDARAQTVRIVRDTALFVAGFTAVFVALGLTATEVGSTLLRDHVALTRISGALVLAMALFLAGSLAGGLPWLYGERRLRVDVARFGPLAAPVAGVAFGFGWTPCIGPILSSVLAVAAVKGSAAQGAGLLAAYSLGLGVPFLVIGLAAGKLGRTIGFLKRHGRAITLVSALVLAGFGVLLFFNRLTLVTIELERLMRDVGLGRFVTVG